MVKIKNYYIEFKTDILQLWNTIEKVNSLIVYSLDMREIINIKLKEETCKYIYYLLENFFCDDIPFSYDIPVFNPIESYKIYGDNNPECIGLYYNLCIVKENTYNQEYSLLIQNITLEELGTILNEFVFSCLLEIREDE